MSARLQALVDAIRRVPEPPSLEPDLDDIDEEADKKIR